MNADKIVRETVHKLIQQIIVQRQPSRSQCTLGHASHAPNRWYQIDAHDDVKVRERISHALKAHRPQYRVQLTFLLSIHSATVVCERWRFIHRTIGSNNREVKEPPQLRELYQTLTPWVHELLRTSQQQPVPLFCHAEAVSVLHEIDETSSGTNASLTRTHVFPVAATYAQSVLQVEMESLDSDQLLAYLPHITVLGSTLITDYYSPSRSGLQGHTRTAPVAILRTSLPPAGLHVGRSLSSSISPLVLRGSLSPVHTHSPRPLPPPQLILETSDTHRQSSSSSSSSTSSLSTSSEAYSGCSSAHTPPASPAGSANGTVVARRLFHFLEVHASRYEPRTFTPREQAHLKSRAQHILQQLVLSRQIE